MAISSAGGGWGPPAAAAAASQAYSTTFELTESPMLEDGGWIQGGTVGGSSWFNVNTAAGRAFGVGPANGYEDCLAHRTGFGNAKHYARGTVYKDAAYTPPSTQEVELVVAVNISAGSVALYEWLWSFGGGMQIVRWNGPAGDFKFDLPATGPGVGVAVTGDVMELQYDATNTAEVVLRCYMNGALVVTATDNTAGRLLTGSPGLSFFARPGSGLDMSKYAFSDWSCGVQA